MNLAHGPALAKLPNPILLKAVFGPFRIQLPHMRDYHALDWLLDAYLRLGRLDDARGVMTELDAIEAEIDRRGEGAGQFPSLAETLRTYYSGVVQ